MSSIVLLPEFKLYLGVDDSGEPLGDLTIWDEDHQNVAYSNTDYDAVLQQCLDAAEGFVQGYTGRTFGITSYPEYYDGDGQREVILKNFPVTALTSFEINTGTFSTEVLEDVDPDSYKLIPDKGIIRLNFYLARGFQNYKITYSAGYSAVPGDIVMAIKQLAASYYTTRQSNGVKSETVAGDRLDFAESTIDNAITLILDQYRDGNV